MGRVGVTLSTIQDRLVKKTAARRRPYVASFVGSMYTYPARSKMESMRSADILINATDWSESLPQLLSLSAWLIWRAPQVASKLDKRDSCRVESRRHGIKSL